MPKNLKPNSSSNISDIDILTEIGCIGAGNASVALSKILDQPVEIEVPKIHLAPPHIIPRIYNKHDTNVSAIFMQLRGKADCDIMFLLEKEEAEKIASLMTRATFFNSKEMEKSALKELGSIMICSFLSAIADFTGLELIPTPPQLASDTFDAVIDGLLVKQALCSDVAVIFDARFKIDSNSAEGLLMTFPSETLRRKLAEKGKIWLKTEV